MCRAGTAHAAGTDFPAFRHEFFQTVDVLIVDLVDFLLAESAYLSAGSFFIALFYGSLFFHDQLLSLCYFPESNAKPQKGMSLSSSNAWRTGFFLAGAAGAEEREGGGGTSSNESPADLGVRNSTS